MSGCHKQARHQRFALDKSTVLIENASTQTITDAAYPWLGRCCHAVTETCNCVKSVCPPPLHNQASFLRQLDFIVHMLFHCV